MEQGFVDTLISPEGKLEVLSKAEVVKLLDTEFGKASGILGGLWEKVREHPDELLDPRILSADGLDVAVRDFLAGMTDRFAIALYERLFIPRPWIGPMTWNQL
jgi:dGTP triphosphohydrolase